MDLVSVALVHHTYGLAESIHTEYMFKTEPKRGLQYTGQSGRLYFCSGAPRPYLDLRMSNQAVDAHTAKDTVRFPYTVLIYYL